MTDYLLADDLSGALDAAAAFHGAGRPVTVALNVDAWPDIAPGGMVAVTTETRNAPPHVAAALVSRAIAYATARGARLVYKKIDSTLRGPVEAELRALLEALPDTRVLFSPANPAVGRTVRDGMLLVHGVPVADTEFGRDPVNPVRTSDIAHLLAGVPGARRSIPDVIKDADLAAAVTAMDRRAGRWIGVGSGGLARPVAARFASPDGPRPSCGNDGDSQPGGGDDALIARTLFVCGSAHRQNHVQAERLNQERGIRVFGLVPGEEATCVRNAVSAIQDHRAAAVIVDERRRESSIVLRSVAGVAAQIVGASGVRHVFATGGETAFALCRALGIGALTFEREIESGQSLSRGTTMDGCEIRFAIKPGGFGDDHTWVRGWRALQA
jgi:D-threonate/D-erythronate kinase